MGRLTPLDRLDIRDHVLDTEFTLSDNQADRINNAVVGAPRHARWWISPEGTPPPPPAAERIQWTLPRDVPWTAEIREVEEPSVRAGQRLTAPWLEPWMQLNDPGEDDMIGLCVLDQADASRGLLIMVNPTREMRIAWKTYVDMPPDPLGHPRFASLGSETALLVPWPNIDYRAVFRHAWPAATVSKNAVRWHFERPAPGESSWDVLTSGWQPRIGIR